MKKKKLNLETKLFLQKSIVSALNDVNQATVLGGGTEISVCITCNPPTTTVDGTYVNTNKTCWPTCKVC